MVEAEAELKALMVRSLGGDGGAYAALLKKLNGYLRAYYRRRLGNAGASGLFDALGQHSPQPCRRAIEALQVAQGIGFQGSACHVGRTLRALALRLVVPEARHAALSAAALELVQDQLADGFERIEHADATAGIGLEVRHVHRVDQRA